MAIVIFVYNYDSIARAIVTMKIFKQTNTLLSVHGSDTREFFFLRSMLNAIHVGNEHAFERALFRFELILVIL